MRVAALLLALTLMTSCFVGGTFAKYTTGDTGSDYARVAKFGVIVNAKNNTLFTNQYETEDDTFSGEFSVDSAPNGTEGEDVVAPGTKGEVTSISITGTPEVAVDVKVESTVTLSDNWIVDGEFYCPIIITVGETKFCGLNYTGATAAADFAAAIKGAIEGYSNKYGPNTDLSAITNGTNFNISWEWAFDADAHADLCTCGKQTDDLDTKLGDLAVDADRKITIALSITVEQID